MRIAWRRPAIGAEVDISLVRPGAFSFAVDRGNFASVVGRELETVGAGMGWCDPQQQMLGQPGEQGTGNAVPITLEPEHMTKEFSDIGGRYTAASVSQHAITNADVIARFLPVATTFAADEAGTRYSVNVSSSER